MKLPSKLFTYTESIVSKFPIILNEIKNEKYISVFQLYMNVKRHFESVSEFTEVIECLYALKKLEYNYELRRIRYVI